MTRLQTTALLWWLASTRAVVSAQEAAAHGDGFELVRDGKPACTIVVARQTSPAARLAALELQSHILQVSGAELPLRSDAERVEGRRVLVGESLATRELGIAAEALQPQEYVVAFRTNSLVLLGRDWQDTEANRRVEGRPMTGESLAALRHRIDYWKAAGMPERSTGELELPGLYDDQGTCLAVYDFLERHLEVRWYGPSPLSVIVPRKSTVVVSGRDVRRSPALKHRSALPAGNWPFLKAQWGEFTQDQVRLYWRRSRQGGERWAANHTFHPSTIKERFSDPAFQSKNPKSKGSQLCYTSPELVSEVARMARDFFDGRGSLPEGWKAAGDYFAIVPDDNMNLCDCPACGALLKTGASRRTGFFSSGEISDYWFSFVNAVAREVRQTHPDKYIATLAYWAYALPPECAVEPNVSIAPCLHTCYYPVHATMKENDLRLYGEWHDRTSAPMYLWVYYHHPMEPALIDRWKCFPHVMVHQTADAMRRFIRDGVRGIFECGEQDQLEQYVMAKVWDDPDVNVDALITEFFRLYFGAAAEPMQAFYLQLEAIACDPDNYPAPYGRRDGIDWRKAAWEKLGTPERMQVLGGWMAEAERRAEAAPERARVAQWKTAFWDWMRQGSEAKAKGSR